MRDKIGYAFGDMGCGFSFQLVSTYMQLFYFQCIGINPAHYAVIIIISKVWDAINDILIGNMVDTKRISKKSKYMPWIMIGGIGLVALTVMIFAPIGSFSYPAKVAWCLASYCLWSVAYTMVNVPYGSLHSVISDDPKARTSLSTFRSIGAGLAAVFIMLLPEIVYKKNESTNGASDVLDPKALLIVSFVFSLFALAAFFGTTHLVTERVHRDEGENQPKTSIFASVKSFFQNRAMVGATLATVASVVFYNSTISVSNLVFQYFFNDAKKASVAAIASYLPLVALMPFIGKLVSRFGKKSVVAVGSLVSAAASALLLLLPIEGTKTGMLIYVGVLMFVNVGNCIFQITVWAIVADCIEISYLQTKRSEESSLYAIYSFFRKLSQGIGQAIVSLGLVAIGFQSGENAVQPENLGVKVKSLYVLLLLIGTLATFLCMKFIYNIDKNKEQELGSKEPAEAVGE